MPTRTGSELLDLTPAAPLSVDLVARPARVCMFVPDVEDVPWQVMVEHALAIQTGVWGGLGNVVVPLALADHEIFWRIVDLHDPDVIALHTVTFADARLIAPDHYARATEHARSGWAEAGIEGSRLDAEIERIDPDPLWWFELPRRVSELLIDRVTPLHHERDINFTSLNGTEAANYPLTDVSRVANLPPRVVGYTAADPLRRLLLTHTYGHALPSLQLRVSMTTRIEQETLDTDAQVASRVWPLRPREPNHWALSEGSGLGRRFVTVDGGPVVVVGDEPLDFLLFHGLSRLRPAVYWLPASLVESSSILLSLALGVSSDGSFGVRGDQVSMTSATNMDAAAELSRKWDELSPSRARRVEVGTIDWRQAFPRSPMSLADVRSQRVAALISHAGETTELPAVYPDALVPDNPLGLGWMVDVEVRGWTPIRHAAGASVLRAGMLTSHEARTSRFGPSYFGQAGFVQSGTPLEGTAVRPMLAAVGLVDQLRRAAPPSWEIGLSDKGAYALESARIFGGVAGLAAALRDPATRAVLDAFARPEYEDGPGSYLRDPRRWVLTFDEIRTLVGDDAAETVLKDLDEREAIRRGHALKCSYCRATSFYTLDEHQRFTCVRCRHEQRATKRSWWGEPEPPFRYALAEVVHQFLAHNGHVPLLATYEHFDSATGRDRRSLDVAFEVEVKSPDREAPSEHDIAASWGADLWLGEATQKPEFASSRRKEEARLRRLVEVARTLHARGIILVTTSESFAGRTGESVARILEDPWIKLEVVEGFDAGAVTATADAL